MTGSLNGGTRKHSLGRAAAAELVDIASFGGWAKVQPEHFGDGGIFDQIYVPK